MTAAHFRKTWTSLALVATLCFATTCFADATQDAVDRLSGGYGRSAILASPAGPAPWIYPYSWTSGDYAALATGLGLSAIFPPYQAGPIPPLAPQGNPYLPAAATAASITPSTATDKAVISMLLSTDAEANQITNYYLTLTSGNYPSSNTNVSTVPATMTQADIGNYNGDSLLGPTVYQTAAAMNTADNYIQYAASLFQPLGVIDSSNLSSSVLSSPAYLNYAGLVRSYVAALSLGVSNLYHLYAERAPINANSQNPAPFNVLNNAGLGAIAQLPTNSPQFPAASPLQIDQYSATRRFNDPSWRNGVQEASPTVLAREQLYLLAEIRYEMFMSRMELQRMTAAMSILQIEMLNAGRSGINQAKNNLLNS